MKNMELLKALETAQNELHTVYDSVKARQEDGVRKTANTQNIDTKTAMVRRLITVRQLALKARKEIEKDY